MRNLGKILTLSFISLSFLSCDSGGSANEEKGGSQNEVNAVVEPVLLGTWYEVNTQGGWDPDTLIFTKDSLGGSGMGINGTSVSRFYAEKGNIGQVWQTGHNVYYEYKISNDTLYTEFQLSPDSLDGIVGSKGGAVQSFLKLQ